jgi:hypothetical protein
VFVFTALNFQRGTTVAAADIYTQYILRPKYFSLLIKYRIVSHHFHVLPAPNSGSMVIFLGPGHLKRQTYLDIWYLNKKNKIRGSQQMRFVRLFTGLSLSGHVIIKQLESSVKHEEKYGAKSIPLVE